MTGPVPLGPGLKPGQKIIDPGGRAMERVEREGVAAVFTEAELTIPDEVAGFGVRVGMEPYPLGSKSHRRAMVARLFPLAPSAHDLVKRLGGGPDGGFVSCIPLTAKAKAEIAANPNGPLSEKTATDVLRLAVGELRKALPSGV